MSSLSVPYIRKKEGVSFELIRGILLIGLIISICEFSFGLFNDQKRLTDVYLLQLGLIFGFSYWGTVLRLGWTHLFSLLQFTTFVFMVSTPLLSPLADGDTIRIAYSPAHNVFKEEVIQRTILIFSVYIATSFLVYFSHFSNVKPIKKHISESRKLMYFRVGKVCMITMLPFALIYTTFLMTISRADLYASGTGGMGMPLYIRVSNMIYTVGFYLIVASKPAYKDFCKYTLLYFISLIPTLLSGERGEVLLVVVFFIWYITRFYDKKIKLFIIAILGVLGVVSSYVIAFTRQDLGVETQDLFKIILAFFSESATTCKLTSFYVENKDAVEHSYPFFLDQAIYGIKSLLLGLPNAGQSLEMLVQRSSLGHNLVYYLNPGYYLGGNSTGTAWVAECYEFGILGVMLGATFLSWFVHFYENKVVFGRFASILTYTIFDTIVMSPRGSLLPSIYNILKWLLVAGLVCMLYRLFVNNRIQHKS